MSFSFHPEAEKEFNKAIDYYEDIDPSLGYDFALEVYSTIKRSVEFPKAWTVLSITITELSSILSISRKTLSKIINGRGSVTPDLALRLSRAFDTTPALWLNLQKNYDLWQAEHTSTKWRLVKPFPQQLLHVNG